MLYNIKFYIFTLFLVVFNNKKPAVWQIFSHFYDFCVIFHSLQPYPIAPYRPSTIDC